MDRYVEVPVERRVDRPVEVPVNHYIDRTIEVPVPVEHVVEVPVDRIVECRDEREIWRLRDENDDMAALLREARNQNNTLQNDFNDL